MYNLRVFAITYIMLSFFIHLSLHMHRLVIACRINQKLSLAEKGWERKRERGREVYISRTYIRTYVRTYIHAFYLHLYSYICIIYAYYMGVHMVTIFHVNKMLGP